MRRRYLRTSSKCFHEKYRNPRQATRPPSHPVTPAVPVSISVRWSIAILALSPPLALFPDRLSLCDSSSSCPFLLLPSLPSTSVPHSQSLSRFLSHPRVPVSRFSIPYPHVKQRWTSGRDRSLLWRVSFVTLHLRDPIPSSLNPKKYMTKYLNKKKKKELITRNVPIV